METIRKTIFEGWNFIRWFRLALGFLGAYQAFELQNGPIGLLAGLFIFQALANGSYCGTRTCKKQHDTIANEIEDVDFEVIEGK